MLFLVLSEGVKSGGGEKSAGLSRICLKGRICSNSMGKTLKINKRQIFKLKTNVILDEIRKQTGFTKTLASSTKAIRDEKFPVDAITRTRGHSFDNEAIIFGFKPQRKKKSINVPRLKYKP